MNNKDSKMKIIIHGVDRQLWTEFRKVCLDEDVSASEKVRQFIQKTVDKGQGKEG